MVYRKVVKKADGPQGNAGEKMQKQASNTSGTPALQKNKSNQSGQAKPAFSNKFAAFGGEDE